MFGVISIPSTLGFPTLQADGTGVNVSVKNQMFWKMTKNKNGFLLCTFQSEELLMPYLNILSEFRDKVRTEARKVKAEGILQECDKLRDDILPNVGVRLEDVEGM